MKKIPALAKVGAVISFAFITSLFLVNCNETSKTTSPSDTTLFVRLGGTPAITAVIDSFLPQVLLDTVIKARFDTIPPANLAALRQNLIDLVGSATGGNVKYGGKSMPDAHHGMNISGTEFDALVGDMLKSFTKNKVPQQEQTDLGNILVSLKTQVINQ